MKTFGRVSICFLLLTLAAWGQTQTFPALGSTNVFTGSNTFSGPVAGFGVITCGLVGDNVTNDAPKMQACVTANPGRRIRIPYTATGYKFNSAITLSGNGQIIEGESSGYAGGTVINFPAGVKGFIVNNATCQGCTIRNLNLIGGSPFTSSSKNQCVIPSTMEGASGAVTGASTDDAIQVGADFTHLENLYITSWGRHAVYFTGGDVAATLADDATIVNVIAYGNRGDGFYGHGADFNAGHFTEAIAYYNQFWGIHDSGFLGNTWSQPQVTGNHTDSTSAGSTTAVNIARAASVVTVSNFTAHGLVVGNAIVISGASDATYNGSWFVASVVDANTITFSNGAGTTSGVTANARIATCTEAWTASGLDGGAYKAVSAAQLGTWINPYSESSQPASKFAGSNLVLGGDAGAGYDTTQQNYRYYVNGFHGGFWTITANDASHQNAFLGLTGFGAAQEGIQFTDNSVLTHQIVNQASGTSYNDPRSNGVAMVFVNGGVFQLNAPNEIRFGDLHCGNGTKFEDGSSNIKLTIDCSGNIKLSNVLIATAAPTISSGFGSSPSIATNNGTAAFTVNVGTGGTANSGVIGLPTAANGWNCYVTDITTQSTTVFLQKQTASSTTSCTVQNFNTAGAAAAFAASDILSVSAFAR